MKTITIAKTSATLFGLMTSTAMAQDNVDIFTNWSYDLLYMEGWSVDDMFARTEIIDANGEDIGDVENVIFSNDGKVLGVIAQVGGLWDIGDTHVMVPWDEVSVDGDIGQIRIPITEATVENYDVFGAGWFDEQLITALDTTSTQPVDDDLVAGPGIFKATDLIGDYAYLQDNVRYGYVSDLIVHDGALSAVVMDGGAYGRRGYYGYPYSAQGYMNGGRYDMPYTAEQIGTIENFDYQQMQSRGQQ